MNVVKVPEEVVRGRGYAGHKADGLMKSAGTWLVSSFISSFSPNGLYIFDFLCPSSLNMVVIADLTRQLRLLNKRKCKLEE